MVQLLLVTAALAHPAADDRFVPEGCEDVPQLFRRSAALTAESRFDEAKQEIHKAAHCGADPAETQLVLADIAVKDNRPAYALSLLDKITTADLAGALVVRSDALAAQGLMSEAADFRILAISRVEHAPPDLLVRTAQLLEDAGRLHEALMAVDVGQSFAPASSLQSETIRLAAIIDPERALSRLDALPRTATWMRRRGEILMELGRQSEARAALSEALELTQRGRSSPRQREQIASLNLAIESLKP